MNLTIKWNKKTWLMLSAAVLALAVIVLVVWRNQQVAEQTCLADKLSIVKNRLAALELDQLSIQKNQVLQQTDQIAADIASLKNQVGRSVNSIDASQQLYLLASECNVEITDISASEEYDGNLDGVPCTVMPVTATIKGNYLKLVDFIARLKSDFITCLVNSIDLTIAENPSQDTSSANVKLFIYTYKGS